jgi:putative transposase
MPTNDVLLSEEQRVELSSIAQSRSLPAGYVFRARLILMLAEGTSFNTIKRQLRTTAPTISAGRRASLIPAWMDWILITRVNRPAC